VLCGLNLYQGPSLLAETKIQPLQVLSGRTPSDRLANFGLNGRMIDKAGNPIRVLEMTQGYVMAHRERRLLSSWPLLLIIV
jgi:hypothetical protein